MRKIALLLMLGLLLTLNASIAQDVLVLDTYDVNTTYMDDLMRSLDVEYDFAWNYNQNQWNYDDLSNYSTVIVAMYFGYTDAGVMEDLYEFASAGGKIIWLGGTGNDQTWIQSLQDDFEIDCNYQYAYTGGFELVDDTHVLAEGLPEDHNMYQYNGRIWLNIDDEEFETVAINSMSMPMFGVHQVGTGEFVFIGVQTYQGYWAQYPADVEVLEQMMTNALSYVRGSLLYGTITNATTHQPVYDVSICLYDAVAETLASEDFSDSMGYYGCSHYLLEGMQYYATYNKPLYVGQMVDELEGIPPDNIEHNVTFVPFLQTDLEAIQTEVPRNTWVDVTGIITVPTNTTDLEHASFYIQDETQYGVHIYSDDPWDAEAHGDLNRGDEVRIVGRLDEYEGITEINDLYLWEVLSTDNAVYDPLTMNSGTMSNMQEMEGTWAHIVGYLQNDPAQMGSYSIILNDGSGDCNVRIQAATNIDLTDWEQGDWLMVNGIISLFENEVQLLPSLEIDVYRTPMIVPDYGRSTLEDSTGVVSLRWDHTTYGTLDKLGYDHGPPSGYYSWPGNKMATRVSPKESCRLIAIRYYVWTEEPGSFNAQIFQFNTELGAPEAEPFRDIEVELNQFQGWHEIILSDEDIVLEGDFVIGFDSYDNNVRLGMNMFDNGRAWDWNGDSWRPWVYSYYIRAVVQYDNGAVGEIEQGDPNGNELDEWQQFTVYRDGAPIGNTYQDSYTDTLPELGEYEYTITATYHEGETRHSDVELVVWSSMDVGESQASSVIPVEWAITAIYPNPFNPVVNVVLAVPSVSNVQAEIFDILGRNVAILDLGQLQPGYHDLNWHANGPSGTYFMKITSSTGWSDVRKLVYMR
ncbi:MAG: T9SS type A sorting domain-containing protein [Candidatus Electryonea clarkiae]|nr:T9SS type A sorting domain-containing protein [Candidatus Electryonea clarkiae]MDP8286364.1 T9SS type A sorting domain-containing protein [Candidatus Electryonea clarkiae]